MSSTIATRRVLTILPAMLVVAVLAAANPLQVASLQAAAPPAASVLPDETVVYVSVADSTELSKNFLETAIGQMSQEPRMKSLIARLYAELNAAAAPLEERLGLRLDDLLAIPQGQIALALVAPEGRPPAVVGVMDVGDQILAVQLLLEKLNKALTDAGATRTTESAGDTKLTLYKIPGTQQRQVAFFQREGTLVIGSSIDVLKKMVTAWEGKREGTLALNKKYSTITTRCRGTSKDRPQITWYADPLATVHSLTQNNDILQIGLALLEEQLGLGGLRAVGGSITLATENFDSISRMHVLLDNPREGVIEMLALGSGDTEPEKWVPRDVASYTTLHWHVKTTYREIADVVDTFQGEGFTASRSQRFFDQLGLDFQKEVMALLDNRFTYVTWVKQPVVAGSNMQMLGVRVNDTEKAKAVFEKVMKRLENRNEKDAYAGKTYYRFPPTRPDPEVGPPRAHPCVALLGEYLLICDRPPMMEHAIKTSLEGSRSLASAADFQLIAKQAAAQARGTGPAMVSFNRPEEGMKFLYDMLTGKDNRDRMRAAGERYRVLGRVNKALDENPLPPFAELKKFLAPAGAVMIDEVDGIHYVNFGLKPAK